MGMCICVYARSSKICSKTGHLLCVCASVFADVVSEHALDLPAYCVCAHAGVHVQLQGMLQNRAPASTAASRAAPTSSSSRLTPAAAKARGQQPIDPTNTVKGSAARRMQVQFVWGVLVGADTCLPTCMRVSLMVPCQTHAHVCLCARHHMIAHTCVCMCVFLCARARAYLPGLSISPPAKLGHL